MFYHLILYIKIIYYLLLIIINNINDTTISLVPATNIHDHNNTDSHHQPPIPNKEKKLHTPHLGVWIKRISKSKNWKITRLHQKLSSTQTKSFIAKTHIRVCICIALPNQNPWESKQTNIKKIASKLRTAPNKIIDPY